MWEVLIRNLRAIQARSLECKDEINQIVKYAESTKAESKELAYLLICLYAKCNNDDLELNAYFLECFETIGLNAVELGSFKRALDIVTQNL